MYRNVNNKLLVSTSCSLQIDVEKGDSDKKNSKTQCNIHRPHTGQYTLNTKTNVKNTLMVWPRSVMASTGGRSHISSALKEFVVERRFESGHPPFAAGLFYVPHPFLFLSIHLSRETKK